MAAPVLAIDFGTSASSAMLVTSGQDREQYVGDPGTATRDRSWPSAVYWDGAQLHVGQAAERKKMTEPHRYRAQFKPALREKRPIVLGGHPFLPEELVVRVLTAMRDAAEHQYKVQVRSAVLTVPPGYLELGDERADLMLRAAHAAGFTERVELIPEPVAAALADPAGPPFRRGDWVLVYDFGGGTFDAAAVRIGIDTATVRARSLDDCGGMYIDAAIEQWLCDHGPSGLAALLELDSGDDDSLPAARDLMALRKHCVTLKEELSAPGLDQAGEFFVPVGQALSLKAEELEACAEREIDKTVSCCRELLRDAAINRWDLAAILLVGGSSELRGVREKLRDAFGQEPRTTTEPTFAVVQGAARFAAAAHDRVRAQATQDPRVRAVRWDIPGDLATVVRWHVGEDACYGPATELAEVRLPTGAIYRLVDGVGGTVKTLHAGVNQAVRSGDWLLTAWRSFAADAWLLSADQWRRDPAASDVPVVLSDWTVFAGTRTGALRALAAATGAPRWACDVGAEITAAPATRGGRVYVGCRDGGVRVRDERTGEPALDQMSGAAVEVAIRGTGAVTSLLPLSDGRLLVGSDNGVLVVVSPDGTRVEFGCDPRARPVLAGGVIYFRQPDGVLSAVNADDARAIPGWGGGLDAGHGQPCAAGGAAYEYFGDGGIRRLVALTGESVAAGELPSAERQEAPPAGRFGISGVIQTARAVRRPGTGPGFAAAPVCVPAEDGRPVVYAGTTDGRLVAFDAQSLGCLGQQQVARSAIRSLAHAHGVLYAGADDLRVHAVGARPQLPVLDAYQVGGAVTATPVVGYGAVFVVTADGYLKAFPVPAEGRRSDA